jgi:hypothetical protein
LLLVMPDGIARRIFLALNENPSALDGSDCVQRGRCGGSGANTTLKTVVLASAKQAILLRLRGHQVPDVGGCMAG